jgi:ArsR family transcriptional regulator, nickel/cobalt-responsive transcriptional repressor
MALKEHDELTGLATKLNAVGEPTRLKIITLLTGGPMTVGQIADELGIVLVNVSHHLGILRTAELLQDEKEGRYVRYTLSPDVCKSSGSSWVIDLGGCRLEIPKSAGNSKPKKAK